MKTLSFLRATAAQAAKAVAFAVGTSALLATLLAAPAVQARDNVTWSVGVGGPSVVIGATNGGGYVSSPSYTVKPPIYYVPPPLPPVYSVGPNYHTTPPVVYAPPVYSYQYQYRERRSSSYRRHDHDHDRWYNDRDRYNHGNHRGHNHDRDDRGRRGWDY